MGAIIPISFTKISSITNCAVPSSMLGSWNKHLRKIKPVVKTLEVVLIHAG